MALTTKGTPNHYVERVFRDRVGFVQVVVAKTYASADFLEIPPPPSQTYMGVVWNRTDITGEPGIVQVRWLYEGLGDEQASEVVEYGWDPSYDTVPIQAHPDYPTWLGIYGYEVNGDWHPFREVNQKATGGLGTKGNKGEGEPNPLLGVETYLSVGGVWTRRRAVRGGYSIENANVPDDVMDGVGYIVQRPPGPVPEMPPERNWLKGPPRMRYRGNAWDITEQWILSGRGGWVKLIYNNKNL